MPTTKAVICRLTQTTDKDTNPCEIIQLIRDDGVSNNWPSRLRSPWHLIRPQDDANCASCWSRDPVTHEAWLCIAGNDSNVKIYSARQGKLIKVGPRPDTSAWISMTDPMQTLAGHGGVSWQDPWDSSVTHQARASTTSRLHPRTRSS